MRLLGKRNALWFQYTQESTGVDTSHARTKIQLIQNLTPNVVFYCQKNNTLVLIIQKLNFKIYYSALSYRTENITTIYKNCRSVAASASAAAAGILILVDHCAQIFPILVVFILYLPHPFRNSLNYKSKTIEKQQFEFVNCNSLCDSSSNTVSNGILKKKLLIVRKQHDVDRICL